LGFQVSSGPRRALWFSPNVPALNECPLVPLLAPKVNLPLLLENDANLFALGEYWLGAGVGHQHMLGITLGTGVGGGLILNGRVWAGTEGTAGEIGHMTVDPEGIKCHCGNRGCLETMASASWTVVWVKEQLAQGASSWLRELYEADPEAIEGQTLVVAAKQADPLARRAFDRVGRSLGLAIANVVHLLGISRVVIGGGFARAWEVFQYSLEEELHRRLTLFPPESVSVCPAQLRRRRPVGAASWPGSSGRVNFERRAGKTIPPPLKLSQPVGWRTGEGKDVSPPIKKPSGI
jgi:glucokinase